MESKRIVLQTDIGYLAPPKPSAKARWLNLAAYATWAEAVVAPIAKVRLAPSRHEEEAKLGKAFGWLDSFSTELVLWGMVVKVRQAAKDEVKKNGLDKRSKDRFIRRLKKLNVQGGTTNEVAAELRRFFDEQTATLPPEGKWSSLVLFTPGQAVLPPGAG